MKLTAGTVVLVAANIFGAALIYKHYVAPATGAAVDPGITVESNGVFVSVHFKKQYPTIQRWSLGNYNSSHITWTIDCAKNTVTTEYTRLYLNSAPVWERNDKDFNFQPIKPWHPVNKAEDPAYGTSFSNDLLYKTLYKECKV